MKELINRLSRLSSLVITTFIWLIIACFAFLFAGPLQAIFFAVVSLIFAVLSLRE